MIASALSFTALILAVSQTAPVRNDAPIVIPPATETVLNLPELDYGPFTPGFTVLAVTDEDRSFCASGQTECDFRGRPLQILLWYPSSGGGGGMRLADFAELIAPDPNHAPLFEFQNNRVTRALSGQFFFLEGDAATLAISSLHDQEVLSRHDAVPLQEPMPLIIHSLGLGSHIIENTVLWEYLASSGYIVAVVSQIGADEENAGLSMNAESIVLASEDLEFAITALGGAHIPIDFSRLGMVGHSFGALPITYLASKIDPTIPLVFLDGSINLEGGVSAVAATDLVPAALAGPILNLRTGGRPDYDLTFLEAAESADISTWIVTDASHYDFQNWGIYMGIYMDQSSPAIRRRPAERGMEIGISAIRLTRDFFDLTLNGASAARDSIADGYNLPDGADSQFSRN